MYLYGCCEDGVIHLHESSTRLGEWVVLAAGVRGGACYSRRCRRWGSLVVSYQRVVLT